MKKFKRVVCILLSIALIFSFVSVIGYARENEEKYEDYPVIIVPGLLENELIKDKGTKNETRVWPPQISPVASLILKNFPALMRGTTKKEYEKGSEAVVKIAETIFEPLKTNDDGSSYYDIKPLTETAEESSYTALKKAGLLSVTPTGRKLLSDVAEKIGGDNCFVFQYDWRLDAVTCLEKLKTFVDDVLKITGKDKANVIGNSYGCELWLEYLNEYGNNSHLNNIVFNSPAFAGSEMFNIIMNDDESLMDAKAEIALDMILRDKGIDLDLEDITSFIDKGFINKCVYDVIQKCALKYVTTWGCVWGVCPTDLYDEYRNIYLDDNKNAALLKVEDYMHKDTMANISEILIKAQKKSINVNILTGEGVELATGNHMNGDGLVDVKCSTGGTGLSTDKFFDEDYVQAVQDGHDHISPSRQTDVSNGYLPENTWVVYGMEHCQEYDDKDLRKLAEKLLMTRDITDVYSDENYPQFLESHNPKDCVSLRIDGSAQSVIDSNSKEIKAVIKNDSLWRFATVKSITINGVPYEITGGKGLLLPNMKKSVTLKRIEGDVESTQCSITVNYVEFPSFKANSERTQYFKVVK